MPTGNGRGTNWDEGAHAVQIAIRKQSDLGEGAVWNQKTGQLYWVDIERGIFYAYDPVREVEKDYQMGQRIGTVVPARNGNVIVALQDGVYEFDMTSQRKTLLASPESPKLGNRFNDGKCDPAGRLWVGTLNIEGQKEIAALYRIEPSGEASLMLDGITVSNGVCWSLDWKTMYYIDSPTGVVQAFDYDVRSGNISHGRVAVQVPAELGFPDGMTIDETGNLWIAHWMGSCVAQWDPGNGKLIRKIPVPALNVTSCAFGGDHLDTLYITTASIDMPPGGKEKYPLAGSLFKVVPGVRGIPAFFFAN